MTMDEMLGRAQDQHAGGVLHPMILVRMAELKHRKSGGQRPECIKLSPDMYEAFMQAYRNFKNMADDEDKDQIDMERPHVLGIPIVCEHGAQFDIQVYVKPGMTSKDIPLIVMP